MAQATTLKPRTFTLGTAPARAIGAVILAITVIVGIQVLPSFTQADTVQPRSEAVLESGRAWQRQYEQMSGLEAMRQRHDEAVVQSGRDWERQQKQMRGE